MSWREQLREASFRGVKFYVDGAETEVGRRTVLHEYPFKDIPWNEDLGKATRHYTVTAYVVQSLDNSYDYFVERDKLIAALEEKDAGTLIHPYLGELQVVLAERASIEETSADGGIARFRMPFRDAGDNTSVQATQVWDSAFAEWSAMWAGQLALFFAEGFASGGWAPPFLPPPIP